MAFKRTIGTWGMLFAAVGGIVGSGWLFGPYFAAKMAGPAAILAWALGGGLMMIVSLTFAELASTFPMAGGSVRFLQMTHGPLVSFTMAWISWISAAAVAPIETLALVQYASNYIPGLMFKSQGAHLLTGLGFSVAAALMLLMCIINVIGVKFLSRINVLVVLVKLIIPAVTVIVLLVYGMHTRNFIVHGFMPMGWKGILSSLPLAGIIFSFIGYSPAIQLAGEAKNPQRSIPIAILGALLITIILYVVLQFAFIAALPSSAYAHGWQHLNFHHDAGPVAGLLTILGAMWLVRILYFGALVSPFGTALIYTTATARVTYAMGENGYLPKPLMKLSERGVPARIIALNFMIGLTLFAPFPTWQKMVGFLVSSLVFAYGVGPLALLVLRKTLPDQKRPFKLPAARMMCILAFYICNLIVYWTGWAIISKMLIAILIGYVVLTFYSKTANGRKLVFEWSKSWWVFLYLIMLALISYLGAFGGGLKVIPFGWDFLAIAIMTFIVYELSQVCALQKIDSPEVL